MAAPGATVGDTIETVAWKSLGNVVNIASLKTAGNLTVSGIATVTGLLDANGGASIDNIQIGVTGDNEIDTASGNLTIDSAGGTTTLDDNVIVSGNLTVNGTQTIINSTTVSIDDKNFQVATGAADDAAANGAGFTVDSGDGDKTWNFEATGDNWGSSENINLASGKVLKVNNTSILSATTLGSSVVNSSLTSVGTLATGVWNGTAINDDYIGTIDNANKVALSAVDIDGGTDIGEDLVDVDEVIVDNGGGGTNRRSDLSRVKKYIYSAASGDATASDAGAITLAASGVTAGTVGSSTAIPILTIDAKGRVTNTSTTAIDQTSIAQGNSSISVTDTGTGTATVTIDGATHSAFAAAGITLSQGSFVGNLTGNVTGNTSGSSGSCTGNSATSTEATNVTVSANNATNETVYPLFVDGATGTQGVETDTGFTYNPSTGALTSTTFVGNLTGNVTGNTNGTHTGSLSGATAGTLPLTAVDIDGATATTTVADADLMVIDDGANGTNRKVTATTLKDYFLGGGAGANFTAINVSGIGTVGQADATTLKVSGISTFTGAIDANGNVDVAGNTVLNGNVDLGNATGDTITATGRFDSDLVPSTDNARDLGASGLEWKDLYLDGTANIDSLVADTADINGGTIDGTAIGGASASTGAFTTISASSTLGVTGTTTLSGALVANGNVDLGNATSDTITATGRFDSDLLPSSDGARDLGSSDLEWQDLFIDGTANIDALVADTAKISDLTSGRVVLAGTSGEIEDSGNLTFNGSTLAVAGNITSLSLIHISEPTRPY